jgi:hypothetical protein
VQTGRTFAAAWAVMASLALPTLARADSSALSPATPLPTVDTNPLKLEGNTFVLDLPSSLPLPLPGTKKLGINLETMTGKMDDLGVSLQSRDIDIGGGKASVGFAGTVGGLSDDWRSGSLSLNWDKQLAPGQALNLSGGADLYGNGQVMGRYNLNLHPELPAAPAQVPDFGWQSQWEQVGRQEGTPSMWGLEGWESR